MTTRARVLEIATSALGRGSDVCASAAPGYDLSVKSWCQIFWLWCLREAGLTDKVWPAAPEWPVAWLPRTVRPEPGDMGYIDQPFQHGAVIESVSQDGLLITSIDGNSIGRVVQRVVRPRTKFSAFYSITPLLQKDSLVKSPCHQVQRALASLGLYSGKVDGDWGPLTANGIKSWALTHPSAIVR